MSFKVYIPDIGEEWDSYWKKTTPAKELELVETDGLRPIFKKYLPKHGKILEAGCGLGKWIVYLGKEGYDIEGVDRNDYALQKLKAFYPQANVREADVRHLPFEDQMFAAYLSLGVVEHFEEGPQVAIHEAFRVLKKGGLAVIEVPFDSPLRKLTRLLTRTVLVIKIPARLLLEFLGVRQKRKKSNMRFYEYRFEKSELQEFMKKAGFVEVKIFPKDDLSPEKSIALWLDYPRLQNTNGKIFQLNTFGKLFKKILESLSPFTYSALIVAVAKKS